MGAPRRTFVARAARSATLGLDEVLSRLEDRAEVAGVVLLGSTATGLDEASDVDLLVVLQEGPSFDVEFTWIEGRPADVVFTTVATLRPIGDAGGPLEGRWADLAGWLVSGSVRFSRSAEIERAMAAARALALEATDAERYFCWVELNVNLIKYRRYRDSNRSEHRSALELMLDTAFAELPKTALTLCGARWTGERDAIRWLRAHEPDVLTAIGRARSIPDAAERLQLYESVAAPLASVAGGLWSTGETAGRWRLADADESIWARLVSVEH